MKVVGSARTLLGILVPLALALAVVVAGLRLLDAAPGYVQRALAGPPRPPFVLDERLSYPSIESAEKDLGVPVLTPGYFPSYLAWPPSSVRGQREPVRVVSLLFLSADGQQGLQFREVHWEGEDLPFSVPEPAEVLERREVELSGAIVRVLVGRSSGGTPVNQLRWRSGGVHFVVTSVYPPEELLRMADTMH